jgi:hypothetical protein
VESAAEMAGATGRCDPNRMAQQIRDVAEGQATEEGWIVRPCGPIGWYAWIEC